MESLHRAPSWGATPACPADVPLLRHPDDDAVRRRLAALGLPRVLLVEGRATPPMHAPDLLEDWARAPVPAADLDARRATVLARYLRRAAGLAVGADGSLTGAAHTLRLSELERATLMPRLGHAGTPVSRELVAAEYAAAAGSEAGSEAGADAGFRSALTALTKRLRRVGVTVQLLQPGAVLLEVHGYDVSSTFSGNNYVGT